MRDSVQSKLSSFSSGDSLPALAQDDVLGKSVPIRLCIPYLPLDFWNAIPVRILYSNPYTNCATHQRVSDSS